VWTGPGRRCHSDRFSVPWVGPLLRLVGYADAPRSGTGSAAPYTVDDCSGHGVDRRRLVRRAPERTAPRRWDTWAGRTSSSEDHASRLAARTPARRAPSRHPSPSGRRSGSPAPGGARGARAGHRTLRRPDPRTPRSPRTDQVITRR
jgi:hypothetical protein